MRIPTEFLTPTDFEKFSNRIVEILFNRKVISFGEGPDGGIDGVDDSINPTIIVQSKRYQSYTRPSNIVKLIVQEIEKLEKLQHKKGFRDDFDYVIVTSVALNPESRNKIRKRKPDWIKTDKHIIDAGVLEELSRKFEYQDVFQQYSLLNGKLSQEIRDLNLKNIDFESELFFSEFDRKYYIETQVSKLAYESLIKNNLVFLVGQPGVGKTTTSQYLGFLFSNRLDKEISVIQRSIEQIPEIVKLYSETYKDSDRDLLIIFDDFLGRNTFDKSEDYLARVRTLLNLSRRCDNLYLIFNTRTQILQTATFSNIEFGNYIADLDDRKITIDVSKFSDEEKALIVRINFEKEFDKSDEEKREAININYNQLRVKNQYLKIVKHKNYFPRLIEAIVREAKEIRSDYSEYVLYLLDNPKKLYDEVFLKLTKSQQEFLYTFASFQEYNADFEKIKIAFQNIQSEAVNIDDILVILEDSWINHFYFDDKREVIDYKNPSILDYLLHRLSEDHFIKRKIIENATHLNQLMNLDKDSYNKAITDNKCFEGFLDKDNYIGEKLLSMIQGNEPYNRQKFRSLIYDFRGRYYSYNDISHEYYLHDWTDLIGEIDDSSCKLLKLDYLQELLFSKRNSQLLFMIDRSDIGKLGFVLDSLFWDVYEQDFGKNEIIDCGEEETGLNLFTEFLKFAEEWVVIKAEDDSMYYVEQFFSNKIEEDIIDYFEDHNRLISIIIEYYLETEAQGLLTDEQFASLDFKAIEHDLHDIFDYAISEYKIDYIESRYGDEAEYETDYRSSYERSIHQILDRDLE